MKFNILRILGLILAVTLLQSCNEEPENQIEEIYSQLNSQGEKFKISTAKDTTIFGSKGTRIFIESNSFKTNSDTISIELKEAYKIGDMLIEGLSTHSNDKLLSSNGMINLKAFAAGKELSLNDNKKLVVMFPKKIQSTNMTLFYGDTANNMNWENDTTQLIYPTIIGSGGEMMHGISDDKRIEGVKIDSIFEISQDLKNKILERSMNRNSLQYGFDIDEFGNLDSVYAINSIDPEFDSKIIEMLKSISIDTAKIRSDSWWNEAIKRYKDRKEPISTYFVWAIPYPLEHKKNEKFLNSFENKYSNGFKNLRKLELEYYVFSSSKLGWINCDFFWENDGKKIDYVAKSEKNDEFKLIFKESKNILRSDRVNNEFHFNNVPIGIKATLFGLRFKDGKPSYLIKEITTSKEILTDIEFTALDSVDELKKVIGKLN